MEDAVMTLAGLLFAVLFAFLCAVFLVVVFARFVRRNDAQYEPGVSVVIPAYNESANIRASVESVLNQDYPPEKLEMIVVDDGSTDGTQDILKGYPAIKVRRLDHQGKVSALNAGVAAASHPFVFTLDADTVIVPDCVRNLVRPFADGHVGAVCGNNVVRNRRSILGAFQNVEYHLLNLIANSFSRLFNNGIWFFGSLACYRKSVLVGIGGFKPHARAEDQDIALEIKRAGYRTLNVPDALGETVAPSNLRQLHRQRSRWWVGTLQALFKNRALLRSSRSPSVYFLYLNQAWWSFYALVSLPLIIYQVNYWLPYNSQTMTDLGLYLLRWFSLLGPVWVVAKIPENGLQLYSVFGVLSGIMTTAMVFASLKTAKQRLQPLHLFAIFFYFPYTIALNTIILVSILTNRFWKKSHYVK
ncbi:glycosyltransferase family 2 protein [Candidatus Woesearchaeota archaeon]|nr:glycosyltransferase family 2 protein [Candidatus Woesearchaeota archaeon]